MILAQKLTKDLVPGDVILCAMTGKSYGVLGTVFAIEVHDSGVAIIQLLLVDSGTVTLDGRVWNHRLTVNVLS